MRSSGDPPLWSRRTRPRAHAVQPFLRSGYIKRSDTVTGLAKACGIDAAGLERTINQFNGPAQLGDDPEFHRGSDAYQRFNGAAGHKPNPCVAPLDQPPFYAVRVIPSELGTYAGIGTNANAQVIDAYDQPIAGLYAVGNEPLALWAAPIRAPALPSVQQ